MAGQTGTIVYAAAYSPYGEVVAEEGTSQTSFGYTGEIADSYTGMVYLRARYYTPTSGIFGSKDELIGDFERSVTLNRWLYSSDNPILYSDPSGHWTPPAECIPFIYRHNSEGMELCYRSLFPEQGDTSAPPLLSWYPSVSVGLSSDIPRETMNAQTFVNPPIPAAATGLCGLIALAMVEEAATGQNNMLAQLYEKVNEITDGPDSGPVLCCLGPDTLARVAGRTLPAGQDWEVRTYAYRDVYHYDQHARNHEGYYEQGGPEDPRAPLWYGDSTGSLISSNLRRMLVAGHYVLALSQMEKTDAWGRVSIIKTTNSVGHWFVVTAMSNPWNSNESSIYNWVRVNNPYSNRIEYYPWWYFKKSMFTQTPILVEIWQNGE